jgi:Fic family protein
MANVRENWLFEYVSISRLLPKAPSQYGLSFLHTETDGFDATYFLLYQLGILRRSIEDLQAYLVRKMAEVRETEALLRRLDFIPATDLRERLGSAGAG